MPVVAIEVPTLGNRTHLVHDGRTAVVVDPPRDHRVVERAAEAAGVEIAAVADTHVHNDYLSGALGLARRHGADYLLAADEHVSFERVGVRHDDVLAYGGLRVRVLATPGHTRHHQSFLVDNVVSDEPGALLSGGSLLLGTVGRTDLVDPRLATHLAGLQWDSARALTALDPSIRLLPTHGFGGFCAAAPTGPAGSAGDHLRDDLGAVLRTHPALLSERETFVTDLVAGFGPVPTYAAHMDPLNRSGAGAATPRATRPVTGEEVADAVLGGSWVIDVRSRDRFAEAHLPGAVNVEYSAQFATYVGWLVPWSDDIVLLTDSPDVLEPALADLAAIGIEGVAAHVVPTGTALTAGYRRADWAAYREARGTGTVVLVDVRQDDEWRDGHVPGAIHVPVQDVEHASRSLPAGELWVHCRSGYRAGIAASLLHRLGRDVVHVDDAWDNLGDLAVETTRTAA